MKTEGKSLCILYLHFLSAVEVSKIQRSLRKPIDTRVRIDHRRCLGQSYLSISLHGLLVKICGVIVIFHILTAVMV